MSETTTTKERPIIFTGESVRAILDGRKTMTRRVVTPQPKKKFVLWSSDDYRWYDADCVNPGKVIREQYGEPGDHLWVREAWLYVGLGSGSNLPIDIEETRKPENHTLGNVWFKADAVAGDRPLKWRSPLFMPRWASRLTLEVTGVRVERVQSITEADAEAEGYRSKWYQGTNRNGEPAESRRLFAREQFAASWERLNAGRGYSWAFDPFVWVVSFAVVDGTGRGA